MKAARFYAAGDVRIDDVPAPAGELGPHDVLVRNRECGICGTDLHEYSHGPVYTSARPHRVTGVSLPTILGHEFSGLIEATGSEVRSVRPGDRVAIMPQVFCGRCPQCLAGRQQTCMNLAAVGLTWPWGVADRVGQPGDLSLADDRVLGKAASRNRSSWPASSPTASMRS